MRGGFSRGISGAVAAGNHVSELNFILGMIAENAEECDALVSGQVVVDRIGHASDTRLVLGRSEDSEEKGLRPNRTLMLVPCRRSCSRRNAAHRRFLV